MSLAMTTKLSRERLLDILREAGPDGVTQHELLLAHNIGNVHAHIESLRFDGFVVTGSSERNALGWSDTRYVLTLDPAAERESSAGSSTGGEPGSQPPSGSPARDVSQGEPSEKREDST